MQPTRSGSPENRCDDPETILIVDDEQLILRLLKKYFSQHGYNVLVASDGEQALAVYRRHKDEIGVVILDVRLPKKTGEEVFRKMKESNPAVRVIVASGYLAPSAAEGATFAGVKRFVYKPYILTQLLEVVREVLGNE